MLIDTFRLSINFSGELCALFGAIPEKSLNPAGDIRRLERIGAFAIKALPRSPPLAARWKSEGHRLCALLTKGLRLLHGFHVRNAARDVKTNRTRRIDNFTVE